MYQVYILKSRKDHGYYIGCTSDMVKRLSFHNTGKTPSLRNRRPLYLIYFEEYRDRATAYAREKQIKSYKGGEAFKKLIHRGGVA